MWPATDLIVSKSPRISASRLVALSAFVHAARCALVLDFELHANQIGITQLGADAQDLLHLDRALAGRPPSHVHRADDAEEISQCLQGDSASAVVEHDDDIDRFPGTGQRFRYTAQA